MNVVGALLPCVAVGCWDARMTNTMGAGASTPPGITDSPSPSNTTDQFAVPPVRERKKAESDWVRYVEKEVDEEKKIIQSLRPWKSYQEAVNDWSGLEIAALLEEYEALAALKDLSVQAELARPPAATFKQDLSTLFDFKYCTDVDLVFRGACFPVHRAILSARCAYFRDLLAGCPGYGARICLELRTPGVDIEMFSALLRYLYTGDLSGGGAKVDLGLLHRLGEEFGHPSPLEHDLRYLLETGDYADAALVFTSEGGSDYHRPDSGSSEYGFRPKLELSCHKAILSARSPFFRNLIQRRSRSGEEHTERALHIPTRIVLDESVIPKRYARVLLSAIYLDTVDLSLILRGSGCGSSAGSLGEVEALTVTGRTRPSALEEAMELYQIGRFLELDIVSQGCEDAILESLCIENLPTVLRWGSQPHGSAWVLRQARHLLREEFITVAHSLVLHQLDKTDLSDALASDFLQASELEILQAVLKWGEHQLVRRMEDREPNVVSQTAHSVTRKGVKKRDLSDVELREILSELLPLVRMDHVVPTCSETLTQAIRRGLVSTPPSHMIGSDRGERLNAWVRSSNTGLFVRPRLFMPYYEEIKAQVEDQLVGESELMRLRRARCIPDIPDTLYMVEEKPRSIPGIDIIAQAIPVPDSNTMGAMLKREQKLRSSPSCQRAIALPLSSRHEINRQLRLRVVREFNLPDAVAHLLESASCYRIEEDEDVLAETRKPSILHSGGGALGNVGGLSANGASLRAPSTAHGNSLRAMTFPRHQHNLLPAVVTEGECLISPFRPQWGTLERSEGQLSQVMPDVAMATGALGDSSDSEGSQMGLDLGDGAAHTELSLPRHRRAYPPPPPPPHRFI